VPNIEQFLKNYNEGLLKAGLAAEDAAKATKTLADRTESFQRTTAAASQSVKSFSNAFQSYDKALEKVSHSLSKVFEGMKTAFLGGTASAIVSRLGEYQKGLYDLSRQATVTGQTFTEFSKAMEDMGDKTALSKEESAKFLKQIQDSTKGVKLMSDEMGDLAKLLSDEFGPKLENIQEGFKTLAQVQEKDVFLFNRLKEGMRGQELGNYVTTMMLAHKLTREQADTLIKVNRQRVMGAQAISEEEKKLRQFQDVQQKFQKAFSNLAISLGKPLMEIFIQIMGPLTKFGDKLGQLMDKNKAFASMVGGTAKVLAWAAIASTVVGALAALTSKLSAAFQLIKSVVTMGASTITRVFVVNPGGLGGTGPGAVGRSIRKRSLTRTGRATMARVRRGAKKVFGAPRKALNAVMGAPKAMSTAVGAMGAAGAAKAAGAGAIGILTKIAGFLGPIGIAVAAISTLATVLVPLLANTKEFSDSFDEVRRMVSDAGKEIWTVLKEVGQSLITAFKPMVAMWQQMIPPLIAAFTPMAKSLIKALGSIMGALVKLQAAFMKIVLPIASVVFQVVAKAVEYLADILTVLADKISGAIDSIMPALEDFGRAVQLEADNLLNVLTGGQHLKEKDEASNAARVAWIQEFHKQAGQRRAQERLVGLGIDVDKRDEATRGAFRVAAIQEVLGRELAKRRAAGEGAEGQKEYRQRMEKAAVQGNMMAMSQAMQDALIKSSKSPQAAKSALASMPKGFEEFLKPQNIQMFIKEIESGSEYAILLKERLRLATEQYNAFAATADNARSLLQENAEAALQFGNNTQKYKEYLNEALVLTSQQEEYARAIAQATEAGLKTERENLKIQFEKFQKMGDVEGMRKTESLLAQNTAARAENESKIAKAKMAQLDIALRMTESEKLGIETRESEIALLETQMGLAKSLYSGMAPVLAIQGQILTKLEQQIESYRKQKEEAEKQVKAMRNRGENESEILKFQQKIIENENKMTQAKLKQVELTKSLRDQYLDAITAFTQVEGAFSKFIITRESGVAQAMREFGTKGGYGLGVMGAGSQESLMQWQAGGGVQFAPMQQMMNFFKQYTAAAGYRDWPMMMPFGGGWGEQTPAGTSGLQKFDPEKARRDAQNKMTRIGGPGAAEQRAAKEGPPLTGGLLEINKTLERILEALTKGIIVPGAQPNPAAKRSINALRTGAQGGQGTVIPKPETALSAMAPRITINITGDNLETIKRAVLEELDESLSEMVSSNGGRASLYEIST